MESLRFLTWKLRSNLANIIIYGALELSYILNCSANFSFADGNTATGNALTRAAGAFGFISALTGFYVVGNELCQDSLPFDVPLGDTSRFYKRRIN
jgi:succinate-acetate transporter protein